MTDDEKANTDKLEFYCNEKIKSHIILKRESFPGKRAWINAVIIKRLSIRLWLVNDPVDGEIELSISEIVPWGVSEFTEASR